MLLLIAIILAMGNPCATEDSTNCYWDASQRGNGTGTSFVTVGPEDHRITIRL
jgi:hypothetical protein